MSSTEKMTLMGRTLDPSPQVEQILDEQPPSAPEDQQFERLTRAVLFSDIVGSTAFFESRGDDAGMAMVERHNRLLFPQVEKNNGVIIKTIGDAIMAAYPTALDAVRSAVAMQESLKRHNAKEKSEDRISVRIGVNFGQVIQREQDLFGDVVNAAARVEALATAGKVLISAAALEHLPQDFDLPCASFDAVRVKGKLEPIEVFEVRWDPDAPLTPAGLPPLPNPGDVLGDRFEIVSLLGTGGMGQVFEARDRALEEQVALKFIRADLARQPETMARFKQEVKLARSVTHRNICRIHEFLQTKRHTFLSMELLRGTTLTELIARQAPLPAGRAVEIVAGICAGLSEAHERRITHRDLKPSNVMIEDLTGRVVIMDFGIAQLASAGLTAEDGVLLGTPAYMSPEQARGESVGPASDAYAVGAILYELLCGRPPHEGPTPVSVAVKQMTEEPRRPRELNPAIPNGLEEIVVKCLEKDPYRRYPDAGSLAQALGPAQPDTIRLPLERRRRLKTWGVVTAGLAALLAGLLLFWPDTRPPKPAGPVRHLISSKAVEHNARWSPDGRFVGFLRDGDAWTTAYPNINPRQITTGAGAVAPIEPAGLSWSADGNQLIYPGDSGSGLGLFEVPAFGGTPKPFLQQAVSVDVSPDGKLIAFTEQISAGNLGISIARPDGSEKIALLKGDASVSYLRPRWSPDGSALVLVLHYTGFQSTRDIGVYELESRELRTLTKDGKAKAYNTDPSWSPDGKWILYASKRTGTMSLWSVPAQGGKSIPFTQGATEDQRGPSVSTAGAVLFNTAGRKLDIAVVRPGRREPVPVTADVWTDRFPVWSPDGERIAFRSQRIPDDPAQRRIVIHKLQDGSEVDLPGPTGLRDLAWCGPDKLVYATTLDEIRKLSLLDLASGQTVVLTDNYHRIWSPSADPSCRRVVFSGQKQASDPRRLWLVDVGEEQVIQLNRETGRQTFPSFSPSGSQIAYRWAPSDKQLAEAELHRYLLKSRKVLTVTRHASFRGSQRRIQWSADGRQLFYMESTALGGILWKVPRSKGTPRQVGEFKDIHTFDYDISPDDQSIAYPREILSGDLFVLEKVQW